MIRILGRSLTNKIKSRMRFVKNSNKDPLCHLFTPYPNNVSEDGHVGVLRHITRPAATFVVVPVLNGIVGI
jgi:hypothetical protein